MTITKEQKTQILQDLVDKFGRSNGIIFSDYRGLDVANISDLRNRLREKGAETKVAKKTLIRLAAKESNIGELGDDIMEGPVSVTFSYEDEMAGLKVLFKFSKENENLKLLGGIIDGKVVGADEIIQLAKLPSYEELIAKFMGSINAPVSGFVGVLSNLVGGFVRVLNAYKDTLPAEEPPKEEAKKEPKEEIKTEEPKSETPENTAETSSDAVETPRNASPEAENAEGEPTDDTAGQAGDDEETHQDASPDEKKEDKPEDQKEEEPAGEPAEDEKPAEEETSADEKEEDK